MLGCKSDSWESYQWPWVLELIDTCWDVNKNSCNVSVPQSTELIDTCWDVNLAVVMWMYELWARINRYMLGCK